MRVLAWLDPGVEEDKANGQKHKKASRNLRRERRWGADGPRRVPLVSTLWSKQ